MSSHSVEKIMTKAKSESLFSPFVDFLAIGGAALITILFLVFFTDESTATSQSFLSLMILLVIVVNAPHFINSYQLLYGNFSKIYNNFSYSIIMKYRLIFAAFIVPIILLVILVLGLLSDNVSILSYCANAMFFFVGWHYTKQGYGVFVMISVLKKVFYSNIEKKIFLINSYIVWFTAWTHSNSYSDDAANMILGIPYKTFEMPEYIFETLYFLSIISGIIVLITILRKWIVYRVTPSIIAITGYLSIYYLLFFMPPIYQLWVVVAPFFHSLQYLLFVWAYQFGKREYFEAKNPNNEQLHNKLNKEMLSFLNIGICVGIIAFVLLPALLGEFIKYDNVKFGPSVFAFMFTVFINIHHYFIDNIIWRKENKEVGMYLFAGKK